MTYAGVVPGEPGESLCRRHKTWHYDRFQGHRNTPDFIAWEAIIRSFLISFCIFFNKNKSVFVFVFLVYVPYEKQPYQKQK